MAKKNSALPENSALFMKIVADEQHPVRIIPPKSNGSGKFYC
ncbi:MAG: hypothetical protein ABIK68_21040 [bacterium]